MSSIQRIGSLESSEDSEIDEKQLHKSKSDDDESNQEVSSESEKQHNNAVDLAPTVTQEGVYQYNPGSRGFVHVKQRQRFYQFWRPKELPPPPPLSLDDAKMIPLEDANIASVLTYQWAQPLMILGYQRALEATDLYKLGPSRASQLQSEQFLAIWERRVKDAKEYNRRVVAGEVNPSTSLRFKWRRQRLYKTMTGRGAKNFSMTERERLWRAPPPKDGTGKEPNLSGHIQPQVYASIIEMFWRELIIGCFCKVIGDICQMTSPLLIHVMITYGEQKYAHRTNPSIPSPSDGKGVGYSIGLFLMQVCMSIFQHHFFFRSMSAGVHARSTLVSSIFTRSLKMGGKNRSPGKLLNHASTDCSRIDFACQWGTLALTSPIAGALCLALLIQQIKYSALVGFAVLVFAMPIQGWAMKTMFKTRRQSMGWTDKRSKLINELLTSIRVVKSFAQESKFLERLSFLRMNEMKGIRKLMIIRSANNAIAFSLPVLAAVFSFIVYYAVEGKLLNPANLFTALTLFQLLRLPLMFLPLSFSALTDGYNACLRLNSVFLAEQLEDKAERDPEAKFAVEMQNTTFEYEEVKKEDVTDGKAKKKGISAKELAAEQHKAKHATKSALAKEKMRKALSRKSRSGVNTPADAGSATPKDVPITEQLQLEQAGNVPGDKSEAIASDVQAVLPVKASGETESTHSTSDSNSTEKPFKLNNVSLRVVPGELVAIVGPVGSGKSTLFESLLGEVKMLQGRVIFGGDGRVAYCPQSSWIQAASVRENILFGRPYEAERYWEVIKMCELESDLVILPQGDFTEIGEKGTSLSGGQKARVGLARALYFDASTYMLDDPLSAVDPHVAKHLFNNAILGLKAKGKTVLLATHAIHVLPQTDRIITMLDGEIVESGTYADLEHSNGAFSKLVEEFGGQEQAEEDEEEGIEKGSHAKAKVYKRSEMTDFTGNKTALMDQEERNTGVVGNSVWGNFVKAGNGWILVPLLILAITAMQGATVMNSYWLVWWEDDQFRRPSGFYMGVYAALGVAQAIMTFAMGALSGVFTYYAAQNLHAGAITRVLYAPLNTFYDVQPKGRILNRFTKDIDTIDNTLPDSMRMAISTLGGVLGAVILITVLTYYFAVAVAGMLVFYVIGSMIYQRSAREVKRLDAVLRSSLYSHFSETLSGLATVRAYQETPRFKSDHMRHLDIENRAYFFTICNQRFLGVRLDALGALLVLIVALLTTVGANTINPSKIGLALSFILTVSQMFSWATRQISEVLNDMNSAERIQHYANDLAQEAPQEMPEANLDDAWPHQGSIEFDNVVLRYREGLPIVLHDITMKITGGEKTAIVGRTGAGKSSLLTCLLRLIELEAGKITIDGVDISKIGLRDLRSRIGYLPQDPILFSGTIRSNLDPFGIYDDVRLNDALKRSYLVASEDSGSHGNVSNTLNLETPLEEEGGNLSLGQRSLVSLARALVKDSQIILLDEATASVDVQTDALIQETIRKEFASKTLLTIAHRLRTIISYDKVAVFEKGCLAEYDTPLKLYDQREIFHDMCEKANLSRDEIVRAQQQGRSSIIT